MADVTTNALRGIIKTLNDVVAPSIPADDPLAQQELKMVVRYLDFARQRIDHMYARARYELAFYSKLAAEFGAPLASAHPAHAQAQAVAALRGKADAILAQPGTAIDDIRNLTLEITGTMSAILGALPPGETLGQLERAVVLGSAEITAFDRSWYAPLKLERFPDQVRPLSSFIPAQATAS